MASGMRTSISERRAETHRRPIVTPNKLG
jgi:hypothetical protein